MYPSYEPFKENPCAEHTYSMAWILFENSVLFTIWILGGLLLVSLKADGIPVASIAFWTLILILQVALKKHVCSGCVYYGKRCHLGWGVLSKQLFKQDSGSARLGMGLAMLCYMALPLGALIAGIVIGLTWPISNSHWIILGGFVLANAVSLGLRPKSCRKCAMRYVCPGSAAK